MQLRENRRDRRRAEERRGKPRSLSQTTIIMMLQHPGLGPSDISASALVPCLSPPGSLTLDDFTNFTPLVKEELRLAIQSKRLSSGMSVAMKDCPGSSSQRSEEQPAVKREVRIAVEKHIE
ncbi:cyclic AMP-dependent transcription factor ATF-3 [Arapaima gigas]